MKFNIVNLKYFIFLNLLLSLNPNILSGNSLNPNTTKSEKEVFLNVATTPIKMARKYAEAFIKVDKILPDFKVNYLMLQAKCKLAKDIPRIDMPVIEPKDIIKFQNDLKFGNIDIFEPYVKLIDLKNKFINKETGKYDPFPKDLIAGERGKTWLTLGIKDGSSDDADKIIAEIKYVAAKDLIPTQSEIWLNKLIKSIEKYGKPKAGSPVLETTIIVSKDNYILDGHHRFGQVILADPTLKMRVLKVPLDIDILLKLGRSYGNAIGNEQKS